MTLSYMCHFSCTHQLQSALIFHMPHLHFFGLIDIFGSCLIYFSFCVTHHAHFPAPSTFCLDTSSALLLWVEMQHLQVFCVTIHVHFACLIHILFWHLLYTFIVSPHASSSFYIPYKDISTIYSCRSFLAKKPLTTGLFCGKWPIKIRQSKCIIYIFLYPVTWVRNASSICFFELQSALICDAYNFLPYVNSF